MISLKHFSTQQRQSLLSLRPLETHIGERVHWLEQFTARALHAAKAHGARFALIGINEDIGPRANLGRGGSGPGFLACLQQLLNWQNNEFFDGNSLLIVGEIHCHTDAPTVEALRQQLSQLDDTVTQIASQLFAAGLEPIVIGGGHNNAFGLIEALHQYTQQGVSAVNLDPHSDFRPTEGRHSGNGFSYAAASGALQQYQILGLHEHKNSSASLQQLAEFNGRFHSYQAIWQRRELSFSAAIDDIMAHLAPDAPLALELDVDAISYMPSSAMTCAGVSLTDACYYLSRFSRECQPYYCHLAEAAPNCHPAGIDAGMRHTGQALAELAMSYMQGRLAQ
ncbi:formimidoylglutamase [Shewanella sp. NIFS-20-20]|uniref:formimidoylglutamase n=1 Tax=Shewanella sp. NIFS-20-20 TaxID=2853806 RepID=UPI001C46E18B|nr:formimidoylglutamase [Shewanella sp. NIFS-20-20]MBV7316838.1 formimidoylglutamase [Shewanella sp. NIFS-20-20]